MSRKSLFKYFAKQEYADQFLNGRIMFRPLSYFRGYEDGNVRGDDKEGTTVFKPEGGLKIHNQTTDQTFNLPGHAFESTVEIDSIFVFCMSLSGTQKIGHRFNSTICVEINNVPDFCSRAVFALQNGNSFPAHQGRSRIGHRVQYYDETEVGGPRWALPEKIAISKAKSFAWQEEFRLVFGGPGSFNFQNVELQLLRRAVRSQSSVSEDIKQFVEVGNIGSFCVVHPLDHLPTSS